MGWRAIRFCLERRDIFEVQLRAILRAGIFGQLKLMYPMISSVEEVIKANAILAEVKEELNREGIAHAEDFEVGAMIEIPSAALTVDIIAKEVDFFSIGTNDLIQYTLAVERVNDKIAHLYQPCHPAVLRLVKRIVDEGQKNNIWVGLCGEMAADPAMCLILLGMGTDGHIASLFPGTAALAEQRRWVVENYVEKLKAWRVTLTYPIINAARHVVFLISGAAKAEPLTRVRAGEPLPAALVQPAQGQLVWLVDKSATSHSVFLVT